VPYESPVQPSLPVPRLSTVSLTLVAMLAFAANSLLCRLALEGGLIDPASFSTVRVIAGAVTLSVIVLPRWRIRGGISADWRSAAMLSAYLAFFSFAYLTLSAGTGALILFSAVQLTMFTAALRRGESFGPFAWLGLAMAVMGLVYLVAPGLSAPDPVGAALMAIAGIAWGMYSLRGRNVADPLEATAANFVCAVPLVIAVSVPFAGELDGSWHGFALAAASGSIASGLGYVVWYVALGGLTAARAATVQLSVPVIAAFGGILLLGEAITLRLVLASAMTLGGIGIVLTQRSSGSRLGGS